MKIPLIFNIQRFSIHDGGGIRTNVFFKGCPLHCPWCANPEGISAESQIIRNQSRCIKCSAADAKNCITPPNDCPVNALSVCGHSYSPSQLADEVLKDQLIFDEDGGGITLTGGEPLLYPEYLSRFLPMVRRSLGNIAVETCGNVPIESIQAVFPYIDTFLYDLKIMDTQVFFDVCGGDLSCVISNFKFLAASGKRIIPRIPFVPTFTDSFENINAIAHLVASCRLQEVHLLPFHQLGSGKYQNLGMPYSLSRLVPPTENEISSAVHRFERAGLKAIVGGY